MSEGLSEQRDELGITADDERTGVRETEREREREPESEREFEFL